MICNYSFENLLVHLKALRALGLFGISWAAVAKRLGCEDYSLATIGEIDEVLFKRMSQELGIEFGLEDKEWWTAFTKALWLKERASLSQVVDAFYDRQEARKEIISFMLQDGNFVEMPSDVSRVLENLFPYECRAERDVWLKTEKHNLGGKRPIDLLNDGKGLELVRLELDRLWRPILEHRNQLLEKGQPVVVHSRIRKILNSIGRLFCS